MPYQEEEMTDKPFVLNLSACAKLDSIDKWVDWLQKAEASIPKILSKETHAIAVWLSYQEMNDILGRWMVMSPFTTEELNPIMKAFLALEWAVFAAILDTKFEVETVAGLTVMLTIFSTVYKRDSEATIKQYQECLAACAKMASQVTYRAMGVDYGDDASAIPVTVN